MFGPVRLFLIKWFKRNNFIYEAAMKSTDENVLNPKQITASNINSPTCDQSRLIRLVLDTHLFTVQKLFIQIQITHWGLMMKLSRWQTRREDLVTSLSDRDKVVHGGCSHWYGK